MSLRKLILPRFCLSLMFCALLSWPAYSQQDSSSSQSQDAGTPAQDAVAAIQDAGTPTQDAVAPTQDAVAATQDEGAASQDAGAANRTGRKAAPLPPKVKHAERQITREARRWQLGVQAGLGLNPELAIFGVHSQMGPVFSRNIFFRPNADFEWGEITDMVALNLEGVYRFPTGVHIGMWAPYAGAGPSLNFIHQSFQTTTGQGRDISFGNFDYETGFNILLGFENRHGTFFEARTSLYSHPAPVFRLTLGHTF